MQFWNSDLFELLLLLNLNFKNYLFRNANQATSIMDRIGQKKQGKKVSYSASLRRGENENIFLNNSGKVFELDRNRRELNLDSHENSEYNSMLVMIRRYREKEKKWNEEKEKMKIEMLWLKEEINAIRSFILTEKTILGKVGDLTHSQPTPIPTFMRAWDLNLENEPDAPQNRIISKKYLNKSMSPSRNFGLNSLNIKSKENTRFITPLVHQKQKPLTNYFYPTYPDQSSSNKKHLPSSRMLISQNLDPSLSIPYGMKILNQNSNSNKLSNSKQKHNKNSSKSTLTNSDKFAMYDMPLTTVTLKNKQKYQVKITSTNDASTLPFD